VNFAVFSDHAQAVEVCVYDAGGLHEVARHGLNGPRDGIWSGFLPGAAPGLVYGLRAYGPYDPTHGHRFNPHKLLLDPNAREILMPPGGFRWGDALYGFEPGHPDGDLSFDRRDSGSIAPKARVSAPVDSARGCVSRPRVPDDEVVLYEVHVKNFTQTLPGLPDALRGSYLGLAHPLTLAHLTRLGVTTLSLLPVQHHLDEPGLVARRQINHWGYNTLGFNAADPRYASAPLRDGRDPAAVNGEFRQMVAALHEAGLEVVLDVVYNHTAEGSELGPTLSFRGLDHAGWYRLTPHDRRRCENFSGCGNTLNLAHPRVLQFVLDSLRHWVSEMGVDGFRFDLAPVLGRTAHGAFDPHAAFFTALAQDPMLARARLIAEPWDLGPGGHQTGRFPARWLEWNDRFRDGVRRYWLHRGTARGEFARRFTASNDAFHHGHRGPLASVNFITAHDGFTLADLTAYSRKHNEANGEDGRDGRSDEPCANFGSEGPSDDPAIVATRQRVRRALLSTLLLAQGTPMLAAGDELGHSQDGNNNAYCQDNPTGWIDWAAADRALCDFAARLLALRRRHAALRHAHWFHSHPGPDEGWVLHWLRPDGRPMQVEDWHDRQSHALAGLIEAADGPALDHIAWWIAFNPGDLPTDFTLPPGVWTRVVDSAAGLVTDPTTAEAGPSFASQAALSGPRCAIPAQSLVLACRLRA
jgi:glycogen operon protein